MGNGWVCILSPCKLVISKSQGLDCRVMKRPNLNVFMCVGDRVSDREKTNENPAFHVGTDGRLKNVRSLFCEAIPRDTLGPQESCLGVEGGGQNPIIP